MRGKNFIWLFFTGVIVVPIAVFGVVDWYQHKYNSLPDYGKAGLNYSMTNQDGNIITEKTTKGKINVVDFFFTHCPTVCPKMTKSLQKIQDAFSDKENLVFLSFSIDPLRDSVARLKFYASQFNINTSNWHLLTGDKKEIYRLARNNYRVVATDGDGGPEDFIHSEKLVLIDKNKNIRGYYDGTNEKEVAQLIRDIEKLK